jgi:cell division FtsZ-interacting protein ZapD
MSDNLIPIAFPLSQRMQSFIELRDALRTLTQSMHHQSAYAWLVSAKEVSDMLLGEGNKKPVTPNILSLFHVMAKHFKKLADKHPDFKENLLQAVTGLDEHADHIREALPKATTFLKSDAWLTAYADAMRKQDPIGHKLALPQSIQHIWLGAEQHAQALYQLIEPMVQAIEHLNQMLHAHVPWEHRVAKEGSDQITLHAQDDIGLLIVGVPKEVLAQGILPSCSGFRSIIRLRFTQWKAGEVAQELKSDQAYTLMMVPVS